MALPAPRSPAFYRRLLTAMLGLFGVSVVLILALFGWLIYRSLSEREIEGLLIETRKEAEALASNIQDEAALQGYDMYKVMAVSRTTRHLVDSVLREKTYVEEITVLDSDGVKVFEKRSESRELPPRPPRTADRGAFTSDPEFAGVQQVEQIEGPTREYEVQARIGEIGQVLLRVSSEGLATRVEELRARLVREASLIGVVTVLLLAAGYGISWWLLRRSQRLEEQAAQAERMAYVGTLASGLAHEIRSPLNSLSLNMQMLEEEIAEQGGLPSGGRLLAITHGELKRLERLATDFLSYARPRPLELTEMRAVDLLEAAGEQLVGEARAHRAALEVEDRSGGAAVRVDPGQMRQLLLNLIQNALVATEGTGRPARVVLAAERRGAVVDLVVQDNGVGLAPAERQKAFEIFYSTKKGGTGLGLAIVQRIAQAHEGTVRLDSTPGEGTTVRVSLPLAPRAETERGTGSFELTRSKA